MKPQPSSVRRSSIAFMMATLATMSIQAFFALSAMANVLPSGDEKPAKETKEQPSKQAKAQNAVVMLGGMTIVVNGHAPELARNVVPVESGDGWVTETRQLSNFTALEVSGALCAIEVVCGQPQASMTITAEPWAMKRIKAEVNDETLEISGGVGQVKGMVIKITVSSLESVELTGAQAVKISKISTKEFDVDMSGACTLELSGKTKKLWLDITGASMVYAQELQAEKVVVETCGASGANVFASQEMCASASGVSKVMYYGKPASVRKDASGLSVIKAKD